MAGIYIHIPFCKQACYYCNFHFSTLKGLHKKMIQSIRKELLLRKDFLQGENIRSIYFGGGTPSLLPSGDISAILNVISANYPVDPDAEITLEANPDDLNDEKAEDLKSMGINRLSMGIQSFDDAILKYLHRAHDSARAIQSVETARRHGFGNINLDLIFAILPDYFPILKKDLSIFIKNCPEHISTYCLTMESQTVFGNWMKKGKIHPVDDDEAAIEMEYIMGELNRAGYDHYEISNFSLDGFHSRHNTSYWKDEKYLGAGPSAHSYNLKNRYYNISNNSLYIKSLDNNQVPESVDYLSKDDRINEYIMTSLRTKWGCDLNYINRKFDHKIGEKNLIYLKKLESEGYLTEKNKLIQLTSKGKLIADRIASDLFAG